MDVGDGGNAFFVGRVHVPSACGPQSLLKHLWFRPTFGFL